MAYKLPGVPSPRAYLEEKADFWEIQCLRNSDDYVSALSISRVLDKSFDELKLEGIESDDDFLEGNLADVFEQLKSRAKYCKTGYPFEFGRSSIKSLGAGTDDRHDVYLYLLLCTRLNMKDDKTFDGVDGTLVFEKLCAEVAKVYFGENADSIVFGTAEPGNFEAKMKDMIKLIGEGDGFKNPNNNYPTKNEDGIDVVVWKHFEDKRIGKLIGFCQCKTGTTWQDAVKKLNPDHFCENWISEKPVFPPIPIIFLADTLNYEKNFVSDQRGRLFFNRFRIMEHLPSKLDDAIMNDIRVWLKGALKSVA